MKNKSILIIISVLTLCIFIITGCSSSSKKTEEAKDSESTAQATAEKFLYEFYEVKSSKDAEEMQTPDNIIKSHDKFKTITTSKALESLIANRFYGRNLKFCVTNKCSVKATKIEFEKTFEDKKEGKFGFDYTASVEAAYDKDQKVEKDTEKGYVGLIYEDNQWKVYVHSINNFSKMLNKIQ